MKINITINGQRREFSVAMNIEAFLKAEGYDEMTVAVALNGSFIAKEEFATTIINDGDALEIVAPMQGG